ncbi:MAG: hypothetical protein M1826_007292 [Phylliscum demangeonii]|nr:MAG: hypothetical protein M1826_007292 [Phylliscum demangeonii]
MFSLSSASRLPVPLGQVMIVARSDERADKAAWASRLRQTHRAGCATIGGPMGIGSYFDQGTIATQGRDFLEGVLKELSNENAREAGARAVAIPVAAAALPTSNVAPRRPTETGTSVSVEYLFDLARKAGGVLSAPSQPPQALTTPPGLTPPATPPTAASLVGVRMTMEQFFAAVAVVAAAAPAPAPAPASGSGRVGTPGAVFGPMPPVDPVAAADLALPAAPVPVSASVSGPAVAAANLAPPPVLVPAPASGSVPAVAAAASAAVLWAAPPSPPITPPSSPPTTTTTTPTKKEKTGKKGKGKGKGGKGKNGGKKGGKR